MKLTDYSQPSPLVAKALAGTQPGKVLDVGSFEGRNALYLARLGWDVTAIDTDFDALETLRNIADAEGLSVTTVEVDIRYYETEMAFDAVLSLMVLHFLPDNDITPTINKMKKLTATGGLNVISAFTDANPKGTRLYLFPSGALKGHYTDWNIFDYEETYSSWIVPEGKTEPERYMSARIIASKE